MNAGARKKSGKAKAEATVEVPVSFLEEMREAMERATSTMQSIEQEQAQLRTEIEEVTRHFDGAAQDARDETLERLAELTGMLFDKRPPAEVAKDRELYPIALKSPALKASYEKTVAYRARQGRAAKAFGVSVAKWLDWCERFKWKHTDRCPSADERAWAEGQLHLLGDEPPKPAKRPRGRPVGSKDSKPRKKRATKKK